MRNEDGKEGKESFLGRAAVLAVVLIALLVFVLPRIFGGIPQIFR